MAYKIHSNNVATGYNVSYCVPKPTPNSFWVLSSPHQFKSLHQQITPSVCAIICCAFEIQLWIYFLLPSHQQHTHSYRLKMVIGCPHPLTALKRCMVWCSSAGSTTQRRDLTSGLSLICCSRALTRSKTEHMHVFCFFECRSNVCCVFFLCCMYYR